MIRRTAIALVAAILGVFAAQAVAEQQKFPTRLSIAIERDPGQDVIFGKVSSKEDACKRNRTVKLLHREVKQDEKWKVIARPRTNAKGRWKFRARPNQNGDNYATPGYYHVRIEEKSIRTGDGTVVCKEKYSSPMFLG